MTRNAVRSAVVSVLMALVLVLALYAGLRGAAQGRRAMFRLPVAWLAGGHLGLRVSAAPIFPVPALSFLILGALVAADLRLPANGVAVLSAVLGLVHGVLNGAALRQGAGGLGLLDIMAALFVLVALAPAFVVSLERPWTRIAVRVAGSWVAASGLPMLGRLFRGQGWVDVSEGGKTMRRNRIVLASLVVPVFSPERRWPGSENIILALYSADFTPVCTGEMQVTLRYV